MSDATTPGSIDSDLASMLLGVMPLSKADEKRITAALNKLEHARDEYHQRIITANQNGASVRDIAAVVGVSHQTIHNIISAHPRPRADS